MTQSDSNFWLHGLSLTSALSDGKTRPQSSYTRVHTVVCLCYFMGWRRPDTSFCFVQTTFSMRQKSPTLLREIK